MMYPEKLKYAAIVGIAHQMSDLDEFLFVSYVWTVTCYNLSIHLPVL